MCRPIEVKANIEDRVADALRKFEPPGPVVQRQIWFAEDRNDRGADTPRLYSAGVIVRFRSGDDGDDSTVKLRPCTESDLVAPWSDKDKSDKDKIKADGFEYRVEGDWSGKQHFLSASAVTSFPEGSLAASVGGGDTAGALRGLQRDFFRTCGRRRGVRIDGLAVFGPIAACKWRGMPLNGLKVDVERWTVLGLDFLELSIRVEPRDGEHARAFESRVEKRQAKLHAAIDGQGVTCCRNVENKTLRVLMALGAAQEARPLGGR